MRRRLIAIVSLMLMLAATGLCAAQSGTGEIDQLAERADAVVVGELQSGWQGGYAVAFDLSVVRSLKGELTPGAVVSVTWSSGLRADKQLHGNYGMWFLSRAEGGKWRLLGVHQGQYPFEGAYLPVAKGSKPSSVSTASPPATVSDAIAIELVAAMQGYKDYSELGRLATGLYGIGNSAVVHDLYESLRRNADPELRFVGVTGLLHERDISALGDVAANLDLIPKLHAQFVTPPICSWLDPNPVAIGYLGRIALSPDASLQRCAAEALAYIHTRPSLPFLSQLLDSPDARIREWAITGLSRFVDNLPIPTFQNVPSGAALVAQGPTPYRTEETDKYSLSRSWLEGRDEAPYLQFWKSWWAAMKNTLAVNAP